jgi:uncharacterized protein involved in tellurium resistance
MVEHGRGLAMPSLNVDLVFVIDASDSMQPCFDALRTHLNQLIQPMQGYVSTVRFGLVAQSAGSVRGEAIYDHQFLCGSGMDAIKKLYQKGANDPDPRNEFFTADPKTFASSLAALKPQGNEEMLVALDVAADFPFGPLSKTKRVIALFSDEPFEGGISKDTLNSKIPALSKKLMDRHIQLFVAIPDSPAIQELAMVDRSEVELVDGGNGLKGVDFRQLLAQMGKSISGSSMQSIGEPPYQRAIFGQDSWDAARTINAGNRDVVLRVGESANLDTSTPIQNVRVRMNWTRAIDLDLHAFYTMRGGTSHHVYFACKGDVQVHLDQDAGVGDIGGKNEENIVVEELAGIAEIVFATQIFGDGDRFCDYDGRVVIETGNGENITVPLSAQQTGVWCTIARIDNRNSNQPKVINVNFVSDDEPST